MWQVGYSKIIIGLHIPKSVDLSTPKYRFCLGLIVFFVYFRLVNACLGLIKFEYTIFYISFV